MSQESQGKDFRVLQAAMAVVAGAAAYMKRREPSGDAFGEGSAGSALAAPFGAVGGAFGWLRNKIPGTV